MTVYKYQNWLWFFLVHQYQQFAGVKFKINKEQKITIFKRQSYYWRKLTGITRPWDRCLRLHAFLVIWNANVSSKRRRIINVQNELLLIKQTSRFKQEHFSSMNDRIIECAFIHANQSRKFIATTGNGTGNSELTHARTNARNILNLNTYLEFKYVFKKQILK